jgi:hypothetical protein
MLGPGLMVLVAANLAVFAAIVVLLYELCRRAWGRPAALAGTAVFVSVFGFSQLVGIGNYNFATPYSHETTHGFLVCLVLVAILGRWIHIQSSFLGLDRPLENLYWQTRAAAMALLVPAAVGGLAWCAGRVRQSAMRYAVSAIAAAAIVVAGLRWIAWLEIGRALPGLLALAAMLAGVSARSRTDDPGARAQSRTGFTLLLVVLAGTLMLRMGRAGRVFHDGFYQSALAGVVVTTMLLCELPRRAAADAWTRRASFAAVALTIGVGCGSIASHSASLLALKTDPIGSGGRDQFLGYPLDVQPGNLLVKLVAEEMKKQPEGTTLLVVPEGIMINYLARKASIVAPFAFFSATTSGSGEAQVVKSLEAHPPDWGP